MLTCVQAPEGHAADKQVGTPRKKVDFLHFCI